MIRFRCPKCDFVTEQPELMKDAEITHPCPKASPYKSAVNLKCENSTATKPKRSRK